MKNVVILGSTGSIGKSALSLFDFNLKKYKILGLSANENINEISKQIKKYKPKYVAMLNEKKAELLKKRFKTIKVFSGINGIITLSSLKEADIILLSVVGSIGILPLITAIRSQKVIALANKESLIVAGDIINNELKKYKKSRIIPVDSEHNAIFQALQGNDIKNVKKIIITASGGPFRDFKKKELKNITVEKALKHPTWKMGKKITIDSATLMNKGLEVIEAHYLFNIPYEKIEVVIHPQSIVHSMVEYIDGSVIAEMSIPDMKLPILYSLTYPERLKSPIKRLDLTEIRKLEFFKVDFKKFKAFSLAIQAGKIGGTMPACMNAANEVAVKSFLDEKISFTQIPEIIEKAMKNHKLIKKPTLEDILKVDIETKEKVKEYIK